MRFLTYGGTFSETIIEVQIFCLLWHFSCWPGTQSKMIYYMTGGIVFSTVVKDCFLP
jgi:hypothetical protein